MAKPHCPTGLSLYCPRLMEVIPIELFGVHVEVPYLAPLSYRHAELDDFAGKVCDPATGLAIRPENLRLKKWDELYGYDLVGQFFGDNGQLTRSAERVKLFVRNARTQGDWNIIQQTLSRFYVLSELSSKS